MFLEERTMRKLIVPVCCLLVGAAFAAEAATNRPASWAQSVQLDGVPNLHQLSADVEME